MPIYGFRVFDETTGSCLEEALGFYRDEAAIHYGATLARGRPFEVWRGAEKIAQAAVQPVLVANPAQ
jgi:hypothetical protein